jgi:hypothetical protein
MQKRKIIILTISIVALSGVALAGSWAGWFNNSVTVNELPAAKEEFQHICERMKGDMEVNLAGTITLYDGEKPAEAKEKTTYRYIRKQEQCFSQLSYLQTFCNGKMTVQLDTVNQVIMVFNISTGKRRKKGMMQLSPDMLFDEKADFRIMGKVTQTNNNARTITLQSDFNPEIKSTALTYDPVTDQIKHAVIKWWKDGGALKETVNSNKVWISHIDYQWLPATDMNIDEEINKIITINKDQIEPALKYQNYQLHISNPEQ